VHSKVGLRINKNVLLLNSCWLSKRLKRKENFRIPASKGNRGNKKLLLKDLTDFVGVRLVPAEGEDGPAEPRLDGAVDAVVVAEKSHNLWTVLFGSRQARR
jgi:hypothetical protein